MISNEIFNPCDFFNLFVSCGFFHIWIIPSLYINVCWKSTFFLQTFTFSALQFLSCSSLLSITACDVKCFINHFAPSACDQTRIYWFLSNNWCMVQYGGETNCPVHMELNFCQTAFWFSSDSGCLKKTHFFVTSSVFINFQRWATTKICSFEKY